MTKKMREKIAEEYHELLSALKERKKVFLVFDIIYGLDKRSIERYVREDRSAVN